MAENVAGKRSQREHAAGALFPSTIAAVQHVLAKRWCWYGDDEKGRPIHWAFIQNWSLTTIAQEVRLGRLRKAKGADSHD